MFRKDMEATPYQADHTRGDENVQNIKSIEHVRNRGPEDENKTLEQAQTFEEMAEPYTRSLSHR